MRLTKKKIRTIKNLAVVVIALLLGTNTNVQDYAASTVNSFNVSVVENTNTAGDVEYNGEIVPAYSGIAHYELNNNMPWFTSDMLVTESYEYYSDLDELGRTGQAIACVGQDIMPTEKRGSIGSVKPAGWHTIRYDDLISDKYLYNRCHLIGYQMTGENANKLNLQTGTRQFNLAEIPFENAVADYVKQTGNHVIYRVTPVFEGDNLVSTFTVHEAYSVEDNGSGVCFNVAVYNVQDGVVIDYATGNSMRAN